MPPLNYPIRQNPLEYLLSDCDEILINIQQKFNLLIAFFLQNPFEISNLSFFCIILRTFVDIDMSDLCRYRHPVYLKLIFISQ
jgi:hypothetical protein